MPFKVLPASLSDIPTLIDIYFAAFQNPFALAIARDTPRVRKWWTDMIVDELQNQPDAALYKLVEYAAAEDDDDEEAEQPSGRIIAWAKWLRPKEGGGDPEQEMKFPDLPDEVDRELFANYFTQLAKRHKELMGPSPHWYLELLATRPKHQGRGAGSMLISHVLLDAENAPYDAYLEASPHGVSTYRRLGFERVGSLVIDIEGHGDYETLLMKRRGNGGKVKETTE